MTSASRSKALAKVEHPISNKLPDGFAINKIQNIETSKYLQFYRDVGEAFFWWERIAMDSDELAQLLHDKNREFYVLQNSHTFLGYGEVIYHLETNSAQLDYFGLVQHTIAKGLGSILLNVIVTRFFSQPNTSSMPKQLHVSTCTLDHHHALPFYKRNGFKQINAAIEYIKDPRISGYIPKNIEPRNWLLD